MYKHVEFNYLWMLTDYLNDNRVRPDNIVYIGERNGKIHLIYLK